MYVLYGFLTIAVEGTVCAVTVTVRKVGTHGIPMINPSWGPMCSRARLVRGAAVAVVKY